MIRAGALIIGGAVVVLLALSGIVHAQTASPCDEWSRIAIRLFQHHGESQAWTGMTADGTVRELWLNDETGGWTLLKVEPSGRACVMMIGEAGGMTTGLAGKGERL